MAGGRIAGITIEIGGDTQKLNKALSGVNKDLNSTSRELKDVNRLLKLDPKNTTLLAQKQRLLADQIGKTKDKLKTLKDAEEQAREAFEKGEIGQKEFDGLQREIAETEQKLKDLEDEVKKLPGAFQKVAEAGKKLKGAGEAVEGVGKKMMPVTAAVAGIGTAATKVTSDFDSSMSQVQATLGITKDSLSALNGENVNTMDSLGRLAKEMGGSTAFSAKEAADAINYLALAGYDTQEIYNTLPTVMTLAAAGNMDLATASDMVTDAMSALGMDTSEAATMVDQMAKTASISNTSVEQLGEGMLKIGGTAKTLSGGTAELSTALGILANNGIKGAEGGTHLRNIIMSLQNPTSKASELMKDMGINVYDAEGKMRPLNDILGDLNASLADSTDEEKQNVISKIFNKTDLASAQALLSATGDEWNNMTAQITNSGGAAQQMADTQLDNLEGKLTLVKSQLEGVGIQLGDILMPYIEKAVDKISQLVEWFSNLDTGTQKTIMVIAGIVAAIGPLLIVIGKTMIFIGQIMTYMPMIKTAVAAVTTAIGGLSSGILIAVGVIAAIIAIGVLLYKNWDTIKQKAKELLDKIKETFGQIKDKISEAFENAKQAVINKINDMIGKIKDFLLDVKSKFEKVKDYVSKPFEDAKDKVKDAIDKIKDKIDGFKDKLKSIASFKWLKIPKISISGGKVPFGIGGKGEKPSFSIEWNAKAMNQPFMLDQATIFGMAGGNLLGGGEKGREMIYGHDALLSDIANASGGKFMPQIFNAVSNILTVTSRYLPSISDGVNGTGGMDKRDFIRFIRSVT